MPAWPRRFLALAALLAVGTAVWVLLGGDDPPPGATDEHGAEVETLTIDSEAVGDRLPVSVVVPDRAGEEAPLLVFLHGRDGDKRSSLMDPMFEGLAQQGRRAPIVAFPDGEEASYWHDRADGNWGQFVVNEVIPEVAERFRADPHRVAIGGISMGGFGAYDIARLWPDRFCAVGGHSPALWQSADETAEGAFDDAEDFARHDVVAGASNLADQRVWLDAGDEDPDALGRVVGCMPHFLAPNRSSPEELGRTARRILAHTPARVSSRLCLDSRRSAP